MVRSCEALRPHGGIGLSGETKKAERANCGAANHKSIEHVHLPSDLAGPSNAMGEIAPNSERSVTRIGKSCANSRLSARNCLEGGAGCAGRPAPSRAPGSRPEGYCK